MAEMENNLNPDEMNPVTDNATENLSSEQDASSDNSPVETTEGNTSNELAELKDSYLRLMAEYDNYRKRTIREKADLIKNGGEKVLVGLLPIVDDFERALQNVPSDYQSDMVLEGITLIYNKFISFLSQNGVKAIPTEGEDFNEELFEAVATVPAQNEQMKGKVVDCVQKGYTLNDKVIRHAKVVVAG